MINRRDLLKAIGLGGILPFVGRTEVDAAPIEASPIVQAPQYIPPYEGLGSITVFNKPFPYYMGTEVVFPYNSENDIRSLVGHMNAMYGGEG